MKSYEILLSCLFSPNLAEQNLRAYEYVELPDCKDKTQWSSEKWKSFLANTKSGVK